MSQTIEEEIEYHKQKIEELKKRRVCSYCGSAKYYAKGFCRNCYARYKANGTPEKKERSKRVFDNRKEQHKNTDWKLRFYKAVFGDNVALPPDAEKSINHVLSTLTDRERDVLLLFYRDGYTFEKIGEKYDISRSRSGQIRDKALRKCRHQSRSKILLIGYAQAETEHRLSEESFRKRICSGENMKIEEYSLSIRSNNCLMRAGLNDRNDVLRYIKEHESESPLNALLHIRNLGRKSAIEILEKLNIQ